VKPGERHADRLAAYEFPCERAYFRLIVITEEKEA